jgi:hypothetical protein
MNHVGDMDIRPFPSNTQNLLSGEGRSPGPEKHLI